MITTVSYATAARQASPIRPFIWISSALCILLLNAVLVALAGIAANAALNLLGCSLLHSAQAAILIMIVLAGAMALLDLFILTRLLVRHIHRHSSALLNPEPITPTLQDNCPCNPALAL